MNMEEVEMFTAPGEGQQKKFMELSEAGFAADQEAPPNQRAHIPKHHSKLIKICHLSSLPDIHRKPHHQTPGFFCSRRDALAIHPNVAQRIRAYRDVAGHANDLDGPMFRPSSHNRKGQESRRHMDPDAIDRVLRKHAKAIGLNRGYSAHSMRDLYHYGLGKRRDAR
jgi:hypothetical protein